MTTKVDESVIALIRETLVERGPREPVKCHWVCEVCGRHYTNPGSHSRHTEPPMDCINQMEARTIAKERQRAVKILLEAPAKMTLSDIAALIWGPFQSSEKR